MNINKIKLHKVLTCREDETIVDIANRLKENKERRIFVVDTHGKLKGIITTTDLVYKSIAVHNQNLTAKDVMTKEVKSVEIDDDLNKALEIMNNLKSFSCPVTDKGNVIGLLSYHDLLGHVLTSIHENGTY